MGKYIIKRLLLLIPVLLGLTFIVFSIISLTPGDPATIILGPAATPEAVRQLNHQLGYDQPLMLRFVKYVIGMLHGDFGTSYRSMEPVFKEIFARFPTTLKLSTAAIILSVIIGVPLGILSAVRQYSLLDYSSMVTAMFLASVPQFWLGLMAILILSVHWRLLPAIGNESWKHFVMPVLTAALPVAARNLRLTRTTMLEIIREDYIRTARAKGALERTVIWKHALRNALMPIITNVGINFGYLLGGVVVIESVFGMGGVGTLTINSIRMKDIPQVTASILFLAFIYCILMLAVDIIYAFVDPRVKSRYLQ